MATLVSQQKAAALFLAISGKNIDTAGLDYYSQKIETSALSLEQVAQKFIAGTASLNGHTASEIVTTIYTSVHGSAPTSQVLADLLAGNPTTASVVAKVIFDVLDYNGFDSTLLSQQSVFETKVEKSLFPVASAASSAGAADVQGIFHVVGLTQTQDGITYWGTILAQGGKTLAAIAQTFVNSSPLKTLSDSAFINALFQNSYERAPTTAESNSYLALLSGGSTRGDVVAQVISALKGTVAAGDTTAQQHFQAATHVWQPGELPALGLQEQVAAIYLGVPGRGVDSAGLDTWSKELFAGKTYAQVITTLINSAESQKKGGQLTGDAFVQHVFTLVHGVAATAAQLASYGALGDKTTITQAIINDLRGSVATDAATVTQQHGFEFDIGTSLLYKTAASLTTTAAGGNATGTVNTGVSHQISNAETAVLTDVQLAANAASVVNLKFADHLANLTIDGTSAATVNLSDNGVNPGVDITVNNGTVILNASSGADDVLVTAAANVGLAASTAKFNLGDGNDSLKWLGNAAVGGANTVSANIQGNGGNGVDTISANFITKNVVMSGNAIVRTATITSNSSQFSNFEKLDLAGYIGKATVNTGSTAANHTFDFGVLTGNAVSESSTTGLTNNVVQAATSNIGSQGFVLSGLAEAVKVINAAGGNSAQLEVTGNATAASSVEITFLQNATDHFNVTFDAVSSVDVNAGSLALNSSSSLLLPTALTDLNIASGGTGNFDNILALTGTNAQVQNITVTGDHLLDLTLGSGYSNVRNIDASANTGGLNLDSSHGGTGDGIIVQLLNILPLSAVTTALLAPVLTTLGLNGYQLTVEGSTAADHLAAIGNTTLTGGSGVNTFEAKASNTQAGITITDFDSTKDKIVDVASGLTISGDTSGTAVADYGTRASDTLDALLGTLVGGLTNGAIGLLGGILGLGSSNSLTAKVGVASVVFGGTGNNADSYVIIDNNNNHTLDTNDSVVYLTGQNHQQLVDTLHYA
ncbi:ABC-type protease/lipase transport system, ATPase and permease components [Serratia plymuthica]|nr:ABC-type protease/lipase transport system, ATPase and permease components [Serratia plymuthica]